MGCEQIVNEKGATKLVRPGGPSRGGERKQNRLAAVIASPEAERPRVPAQGDTAEVFDTSAWQARWAAIRPAAGTTGVYICGCAGTMALSGALGLPIRKVGTAQDVGARMGELSGQRYGSLVVRDFAVVDEPGWANWEPAKISCRPTHPASPVRVLPRQLAVALPPGISAADFEAMLVAALALTTLAHLAASPAGQDLCRRRGASIDDLLRFSRRAGGRVLATEIGVMAPAGDASRLVALVEWMIIGLVMPRQGRGG